MVESDHSKANINEKFMKLPKFESAYPMGGVIWKTLSDNALQSGGIMPMWVEFEGNLLSQQPWTQSEIIDILRNHDVLWKAARSKFETVLVVNSWHTSASDWNEHITVLYKGKYYHVYEPEYA